MIRAHWHSAWASERVTGSPPEPARAQHRGMIPLDLIVALAPAGLLFALWVLGRD